MSYPCPIRWALARLIDRLPLPSQEEIDALVAESFEQ